MVELSDVTKFEKYLLNKREFVKSILTIIKDEPAKQCFETELETLDDIIHHFNLFVKGERSSGLWTDK